jgi:hypothetical protein
MAKHRKKTNKNIPAKGRLRDMADRLWSIAVRYDWGSRCAVCGISKCEAHHLIPRQHEATRYDLINGIALCASHHQFDPDISPHQNAAGWLRWLRDNHPSFHTWYLAMIESRDYRGFDGTKNAEHYIDVILRLREYVKPDDFERIVGIRFSEYLIECEKPGR